MLSLLQENQNNKKLEKQILIVLLFFNLYIIYVQSYDHFKIIGIYLNKKTF